MQKAQREKTKIANRREISPNTKTKKRLYERQQLQMTERSRNRNSGDVFVDECWRCEESGRKKEMGKEYTGKWKMHFSHHAQRR